MVSVLIGVHVTVVHLLDLYLMRVRLLDAYFMGVYIPDPNLTNGVRLSIFEV